MKNVSSLVMNSNALKIEVFNDMYSSTQISYLHLDSYINFSILKVFKINSDINSRFHFNETGCDFSFDSNYTDYGASDITFNKDRNFRLKYVFFKGISD